MTMATMQTQCNIRDAVEYIESAVGSAGFSMKIASKDQLDQQFYDEDSDPVFAQYIQGGGAIYSVPRGAIVYTSKNAYRMACANLYFMVHNNIVPITLTNIPEICNVLRSDGRVHRGRILWNEGMFFNEKYNSFMFRLSFYDDETKTVVPRSLKNDKPYLSAESNSDSSNEDENDDEEVNEYVEKLYNKKVIFSWGTMDKGIILKDFMEVNNMDKLVLNFHSVDVTKFLNKEKPIDNNHSSIINIFNNRLKELIFNSLTEKLIKSNISATIFLDDHEVFTHKVK